MGQEFRRTSLRGSSTKPLMKQQSTYRQELQSSGSLTDIRGFLPRWLNDMAEKLGVDCWWEMSFHCNMDLHRLLEFLHDMTAIPQKPRAK